MAGDNVGTGTFQRAERLAEEVEKGGRRIKSGVTVGNQDFRSSAGCDPAFSGFVGGA